MDIGADAAPPSASGTVVVRVDGSPGSRDALRYAVTAASSPAAELEVVTGYAAEPYWMTGAPVPFRDPTGIQEDTGTQVRVLLHGAVRELGVPVDGGAGSVRTRLVVAADQAAGVPARA